MQDMLLTDDQIDAALDQLDVAWSALPGQGLVRVYETGSFDEGLQLTAKIAKLADTLDHHPDLRLQSNEVEVTLLSHEQGGITQKDVAMAKAIDQLS